MGIEPLVTDNNYFCVHTALYSLQCALLPAGRGWRRHIAHLPCVSVEKVNIFVQ